MKRKRRKKNSSPVQSPRPGSQESFNTPFANLDDMLSQIQAQSQQEHDVGHKTAERERTAGSSVGNRIEPTPKGEAELFRQAMADVEPLRSSEVRTRAPGPLASPSRRPLLEGELEAYAQLVDLVSGEGDFDIRHTDEYMEGAIVGVDPELLQRLRRGDFSVQAHLDLHGMTTDEARQALERFIDTSVMRGLRCVLVIHGRGLNSKDQIPVLKQRMSSWLKRGRLKRLVIAFATAQPCDGGAGALYAFLRRQA